MKNKNSILHLKKNVKLIGIALLGAFIFTFLHSELGLLDFENHDHGTHDYCEIVKNINSHTKTLRDDLPKLEITKIICLNCITGKEKIESRVFFEKSVYHIIEKHSTETYLFNSTFLI